MSLFEDPEVKNTYDKCKYIVKVWEHQFTKKNKRIPSKLDIREAPKNVRNAYRKYFQLKTAVLEESFMDVEGLEDDEDTNLSCFQASEQDTKGEKIDDNMSQLHLSNDNFTEIVAEDSEEPERTEALFSDNQVADGVWGSHLNKQKILANEGIEKEKGPSKPVQSITKKLFCGSKLAKTKRNPRKSLSFSQKKKTETSFESPLFFSQPGTTTIESFNSEEAFDFLQEGVESPFLKLPQPVNDIFSQPVSVNIVDSVLEHRDKQNLRKIDTGWLKRVTDNTGIALENPEFPQSFSCLLNAPTITNQLETKIDYDSDDIIEDSDEEQNTSRNAFNWHIAKKSRIEPKFTCLSQPTSQTKESPKEALVTELSNISLKENITDNIAVQAKEDTQLPENITVLDQTKLKDIPVKITSKKLVRNAGVKKTKKKTSKRTTKKKPVNNSKLNASIGDSPSLRKSTRKNIVKASFEELSSGEEDPFASDNDGNDPEFVLEEENTSKKNMDIFDFEEIEENEVSTKKKPERKKVDKTLNTSSAVPPLKGRQARKSDNLKKKEQITDEMENVEEKYELEYNVKPRIVAPRYGSIKTVIKEKRLEQSKEIEASNKKEDEDKFMPKDKKQQAKEKLEQKIASGNLNDNFVTINLRKKVFARGKKGHNFSKYKKALWKSKKKALYGPDMDMGGCDGGKLVCFNCGQEGHFAQKCKVTKGDNLLPINAANNEEECPYPTLEEATKMASESALSVRKPKILTNREVEREINEQNDDNIEGEREHTDNDENVSSDEEWTEDIETDLLLAEVDKLEEHIKKLDVQQYMDNVKVVKPYYELEADGNVRGTPSEVYEALQKFGHTSFRQGQEKAVMRILSGKSTLVTLSTGSGKSLCYQLPAYLYSQREPCISLVISPLVSLMEDQVVGIPKFLRAACLHTNQTNTQRQKIMDAISTGDLNVLLISPEAVVAGEKRTGFGSLFRKLPPIAFACIDEAHCVSQWSHNFRPSYLMICRVLKESLGVGTILGLTATATRATSESIIKSLEIPDGLDGIISDVPLPDNLYLTVSKDANRDRALLQILLSDRFKNCKSIIVYCTRREECERIAAFLRTSLKSEKLVESTNKKRKRLNLQAEPYHAGLAASRRRTVQNAFMSGELRVVVATVAFGMGINKADIRAVIHFNMPNSFESYVQEVGRAGRDGLPAHCHVFLDSLGRDENELRRHIHANAIDRYVIRKLLQKIFIPCSCKGECPKHEVSFSIEETVRALDIPEENISTLLCYLVLHDNKYIELLNPAYTKCKIISYGGPLQIRRAAKECPPLAMALALYPGKEREDNILEFPIIDVASAMGWESGICKHKLKNLEWITVNNQPKRSSLSVQFANLGFRLLAPGNLSDEQLDEALDNIYGRVLSQESKALKQLHAVHQTLLGATEKSYMSCINIVEESSSTNALKAKIREYFNSADPLANIDMDTTKKINEDQLINDIRAMICMYKDNQFTGRALARIFHGIQSPNYPAVIWGRCKFWRSHLNEDFHEICRIATREIIKMR